MLIRVPIDELQAGMFVARVDGAWLNSPFWRNKFLLENVGQIALLREAGIRAVYVDPDKGRRPLPRAIRDEPIVEPVPAPPVVRERRRRKRLVRDEFDRARELMDRSKAAVIDMFTEARLGRAVRIDNAVSLVDEIAASVARDHDAMIKVTRLKSKNEYTYLHSIAVCALMINLARQLGLPEAELRDIGMAGLLHDIGKMSTPLEVLDKPGALTPEEFRLVRTHPVEGHRMIRDSAGVPPVALDVCLHHHERIDGHGYPFGLTGDQVSLYARMGAICDVYDAITSQRAYKSPWSPNLALSRMLDWQGHFDPQLLDAFIASIGIPPLGALVRLHSNHLGVVIDSPAADDPCTPHVRRFYAVEDARFVDVEQVPTDAGGDRIIGIERGGYWFGVEWPKVRDHVLAERVAA
jgi:putative nucleotidyltransferase with HDIG domain